LNREITVAEMLLHGRDGLQEGFTGKPLLEATARETMGMGLLGFGLTEPAIPELEAAWSLRDEALGHDHPDTMRSRVQLAYALAQGGYATRAVSLLEDAVDTSKRLHGDDDPRTLGTRSILGMALVEAREHDQADAVFTEVLEAQSRVAGDDHPDTILTREWWACSYQWRGRGSDAGALSEANLAVVQRTLSPDDVLTVGSANNHGWSLLFQNGRAEAEPLLRSAVAGYTRLLGPDHPLTSTAKMGLGRTLSAPEQLDEKEQLWTEAVQALERTHGPASTTLWIVARDLAKLLIERGKEDEGFELFRRTIANFKDHYGPHHSWVVDMRVNYGNSLIGAGRLDEGAQELKTWIASKAVLLEDDPADVADRELELARRFTVLGRPDDAREIARRGLDRLRDLATGDDFVPHNQLAWALLTCYPEDLRDPAEAIPVARKAVELSAEADAPDRALVLDTLATALFREGQHEEAIALERQVVDAIDSREEAGMIFVSQLALFLRDAGKADESHQVLRDAVANMDGTSSERMKLLHRWANWLRDEEQDLDLAEEVIELALDATAGEADSEGVRGALLRDLGQIRGWQGRYDDALEHLRKALIAEALDDEGLRDSTTSWLALTLQRAGDSERALTVARDQLESRRERRKDCLRDEFVMGSVLLARGDTDQAATLLGGVAQKARRSAGAGSGWWLGGVERSWGETLTRLHRHAEAETALLRAHAALRESLGEDSAETQRARKALIELYRSWGKTEQARAWSEPGRS
jgi:tetratricopeptide (TPR) repeat protein